MPKDYTDIVLLIFDSRERLFTPVHLRNRGESHLNGKTYPLNGNKYALNLNRAYRTKWTPWKKILKGWPHKTITEFLRAKKIGLLFYQEPCDHHCSKCPDMNGSKCQTIPSIVQPMHGSQIQKLTGAVKS